MTHSVRKSLAAGLAVAALLNVALPRRAHALLGGLTANPALLVAGAVVAGIAAAGIATGVSLTNGSSASTTGSAHLSANPPSAAADAAIVLATLAVGGSAFVLGCFLLPQNGGSALQLAPVTEGVRNRWLEAGVSAEEIQAYEDERPELEAIAQDVARDLQDRVRRGLLDSLGQEASHVWVSASREVWLSHRAEVSPLAFAAISKIAWISVAPQRRDSLLRR